MTLGLAYNDVTPPRPARSLNRDDTPGGWREQALCAQTDPEAFFPDKGGSTKKAKKTCMACPVRRQCLEYALEHDIRFGVWGGLSDIERRKLKRSTRLRGKAEPVQLKPHTITSACGTEGGAKAHWRRDETSCDSCKKASTTARKTRLSRQGVR